MRRALRTMTVVMVLLGLTAVAGCDGGPASSGSAGVHGGQQPVAHHSRFQSYVALGDSYTAAPLVPVTRVDDGCLRSTNDYPSQLARTLGVPHFDDRSCTGAATRDLTSPQRAGVPPQLDGLNRDTDLVTVGIGGNEGHLFARLVTGLGTSRTALLRLMPVITARVTRVLRQVHQRAPAADVAVIGYPQVVPRHGSCQALRLPVAERAYAFEVNRALNQAVRAAATATGDTWIDLWSASQGHDICSPDPWINGATSQPGEAAAYHPFRAEQDEVAKLIRQAVE